MDDVLRRLYPDLRRFAAVVGPPEEEPEDLVQEALIRLLRGGAEVEDLGAYLRRTIVHLAANERRRLGRRRRAVVRLEAVRTVAPVSYPSDVADLLRIDPRSRAVLYLADVEGRSFAEVGELVGLSETAARASASRARRKLRHLLEEDGS